MALDAWVEGLRSQEPKKWVPKEDPVLDLWSDASDAAWAALICRGTDVVAASQGLFGGEALGWYIFPKEATAADQALKASKGLSRKIHIDNLPLVQAIRRGVSSNRFVNTLLQSWDLDNIHVEW